MGGWDLTRIERFAGPKELLEHSSFVSHGWKSDLSDEPTLLYPALCPHQLTLSPRLSQFLPPPGSPPPDAYPENYLPTGPTPLTTTPAYPRSHGAPSASSRFLGSILPTHFRRSAARPSAPRGSDGVFANIAAKPEIERVRGEGGEEDGVDGENGLVMAEFAQKEGPPSYNSALRDAVPPYWEHSVVTPTSYGPLGSFSGSGDDLLLDGLPIGNIFGFAWNCLVSFSFQFVGFLLTYVLHTTHAAKYGSRAGLGATLIQYGLYLRQRADDYLESDSESPNEAMCVDAFEFTVPCPVDPATAASSSVAAAVKATATVFSDLASPTPTPVPTTLDQMPPYLTYGEKFQWMHDHNMTLPNGELGINGSTMEEISRANEWMSFVLMSVGWFVLLTSLGGYWRVKRFGTFPLPISSGGLVADVLHFNRGFPRRLHCGPDEQCRRQSDLPAISFCLLPPPDRHRVVHVVPTFPR